MAQTKHKFPEFNHPPVYETVLGLHFSPLKVFSIPHFGLYWAKIRDEYPQQELRPPLSPAIEQFESNLWKETRPKVEFLPMSEVRCWFVRTDGTRLLQVQRDNFLQNWRKIQDSDVYPHYANLKPQFFKEWQTFCNFLEEEKIEIPVVDQCEVTYINHIDMGQGWKSYNELSKVLACWSGQCSGDFLPDPESININSRYLLPDKIGRLHISLQPAIRRRDAKEILRLSLTVRGKPESSNWDHISKWLDLGHEWIVRGFTDITTKQMHDLWGRTL